MSYVLFDVIRRYLEFRDYKLRYVQNFTDIDDKIIKSNNANIVKELRLDRASVLGAIKTLNEDESLED